MVTGFSFSQRPLPQSINLYGDKTRAKNLLDWMIANANVYGLMPEHISPDGKDVSPASPLSWCSAEFAAAMLLWTTK